MTGQGVAERNVAMLLYNRTGATVPAGTVVVVDSAHDDSFTTTTTAGFAGGVGIAENPIGSGARGRVLVSGLAPKVLVDASVTRGHYGKTHTVAGQATDAGATRGAGAFCQFATGGTAPRALLFGLPDGFASGPSDAADITFDPSGLDNTSATDVQDAMEDFDAAITAAANGLATDTLWAAQGDIAVATGNDAAAVLTKGAAGTVPTAGASTVAYAYPPGYEFDYAQITSAVNPTATSEATANTVVTGNAVAYDGSTTVVIEFVADQMRPATGALHHLALFLYDGSSSIGYIGYVENVGYAIPANVRRRLTPSAGAHTYSIRAAVDGGTGLISAGAGGNGAEMPAFIRITKA